jgi:RecA/RadA recombinase
MARTPASSSKAAKAAAAVAVSNKSPVDVLEILSQAEKVAKVTSISLSKEDRLRTGIVCLDLVLGGGLAPSMVTFAGGEQSTKTTTAIRALAESTSQDVGIRVLWDAEGSSGSSTDYIENIFRTAKIDQSVETLFGVKDGDGRYIKAPTVYYRDEGEMETFFDWVSALLRRLPDKRFENKQWWYVYEGTMENKAKYKSQLDVVMSRKNNAVYIPAESGAIQAFIIIDSWPALVPKSMDDEASKGSGMAAVAREYAKHLPTIKGKLRSKRVIVLGINQLAEKPGFSMGDNRYEKGGNALKYFSDQRFWFTSRALSGVPFNPKGKGMEEEEASIDGKGVDTYRYVHVKNRKNKLAAPNRETWMRVWVTDRKGHARGIDPVWDCFYALSQTGQLTGRRSAIKLNLSGLGLAAKTMDWMTFKKLILLSTDKEVVKEILSNVGYDKYINIPKGLAAMTTNGKLETLYVNTKMNPEGTEDSDTESEEEED